MRTCDEPGIFVIDGIRSMMKFKMSYAKTSWMLLFLLVETRRPALVVLRVRLLALLKYPFYPMFNFDNGMNLISESLTILTLAQLLVVFTFAHIFWRYFVFAGL